MAFGLDGGEPRSFQVSSPSPARFDVSFTGGIEQVQPVRNPGVAGVTVFELARVMGTSVRMIERHYGALLDGARASALDTKVERRS